MTAQERILQYLKTTGDSYASGIAAHTGLNFNTVRRALGQLVAQGQVKKIGSYGFTRYDAVKQEARHVA
jgi:Fe2+ or Zn2+ uptake regulation protein